jgi:hypothetical protein
MKYDYAMTVDSPVLLLFFFSLGSPLPMSTGNMCFNPLEETRRRQLVLLFEIAYLMTRIAQAGEEREKGKVWKGEEKVEEGKGKEQEKP